MFIDEEVLEHFGVKGQKWGIRNAEHHAKKDAKEFAAAKSFTTRTSSPSMRAYSL